MNIFSLDDITVYGTNEPLFEQVTLGIDEGEKIGLVGRNGSGKSTFLRLLSGTVQPDNGILSQNNIVTVSNLPQLPYYKPDMTLENFYREGQGPLIDLDREYENCLSEMKKGDSRSDKTLALLTERMEREGGFTAIHTYLSYCRELGLDNTDAELGTFSGGMIRKAAIARTLASGASFLTLDEPTNHLDLATIEWLEDILKKSSGGFLMVTHDRSFLDAVCTSIIEIDGKKVYKYDGNYSVFLEKKSDRRAQAERAEERRVNILRKELEWLKRGPKARTGKDKGRKGRIENLLDSGMQRESSMKEFSSSHSRLGKKVLELEMVEKSFGEKSVLDPFTYSFQKGERIGILGPNGSGKSTFLDIISGRLMPDKGSVIPGLNTRFAYLDQSGKKINNKLTVLEYIQQQGERIETGEGITVTAEKFLENFLFTRSMFNQPLETLSGGELRRLHVIRTLAASPNFILLDEPTNDLDIDTIRMLEDYLLNFPGCILLVSHDRTLLQRVTDYIFIFDGTGSIKGFTGDYPEYREIINSTAAENEKKVLKEIKPSERVKEKPKTGKKKLSYKEKQEFESLLYEIEELEREKNELETLFASPEIDPEKMKTNTERYNEIDGLIDKKTARWEELAERAEE